jgi:hypothetical protein
MKLKIIIELFIFIQKKKKLYKKTKISIGVILYIT